MSSEADQPPPPRELSIVDALMKVRSDMKRGRLGMYLGEPNVERMTGLIMGLVFAQALLGIEDKTYQRFTDWLYRDKRDWPHEGWGPAYLRECGGDHTRAIEKLLNYVAEFVALQQS